MRRLICPILLSDLHRLAGGYSAFHVVVCNNASTDHTARVAREYGAEVVHEPTAGYGAACLCAMAVMPVCDVVVFVDADQRVVADEWFALTSPLRLGADLVIGARNDAERGALTPQQHCGNQLASALIRGLFHFPVTDLGPFRAVRQSTLLRLGMRDKAYGWTVEMQLKAFLAGFAVVEVPVRARKRQHGSSSISGTLRGTLGAGLGILGTIALCAAWSLRRRRQLS